MASLLSLSIPPLPFFNVCVSMLLGVGNLVLLARDTRLKIMNKKKMEKGFLFLICTTRLLLVLICFLCGFSAGCRTVWRKDTHRAAASGHCQTHSIVDRFGCHHFLSLRPLPLLLLRPLPLLLLRPLPFLLLRPLPLLLLQHYSYFWVMSGSNDNNEKR